MTDERTTFESDNAVLAASNDLVLVAVELVGKDDAPAALIGAAMKLWEAEFGYEGAMGAARAALEVFVRNDGVTHKPN